MNYGTLPGFGRRVQRPMLVTALVRGFSTFFSLIDIGGDVVTASGAVTAGVLVPILSARGSGVLRRLYVTAIGGTPKTVGFRIVRDGVEIFNGNSANVTAGKTSILVGQAVYDTGSQAISILNEEIAYKHSLVIEFRSSVSETNGANIGYRHEVTQ